jgi:hypothetical protein
VPGYSGTPLATKLGIKQGDRVVVLGAPAGFDIIWPEGVTIRTRLGHRARARPGPVAEVILLFTTVRAELEKQIERLGEAVRPDGAVWIGWAKKSSSVPTEVNDNVVRDVALPLGLVDTKVCAIDGTWSGLKLVWRRSARG